MIRKQWIFALLAAFTIVSAQRSALAQSGSPAAMPLATFPATNVGSSSLPQSVTFTLQAAATISSITPVASVGGKMELQIGSLSGCVANGVTSNAAGSVCAVQVTFSPAYAGLHSLPIKVVTSNGTLQLGTVGTGVGPVFAYSPGITTVVAGTNCANPSLNCGGPSVMDGGLATNGYLNGGVLDFAIDSAGNIFLLLSDNGVHRIDATTGIMTLVSNAFYRPAAIALDSTGSVYVADNSTDSAQGSTVTRIDAATGASTNYAGCCANFSYPRAGVTAQQVSLGLITDLQFDGAGNLYIGQNTYILRVDAQTTMVTSAVGPTPPPGYGSTTARGYTGDGGLATAATIKFPFTFSFDSAENFYFTDQNHEVVRRVDAVTGIITTVAGNLNAASSNTYSGPATNTFLYTLGLANDAAGNLYIGDGSVVRVVNPNTDILSLPIAGTATPLPVSTLTVKRATDIGNAGATKVDPAGNPYTLYGVGLNQTVLRKIDVTTSLLGFPFLTQYYVYPTAPGTPYPGANVETTSITNIGNAPLVISAAPQVANSTANPGAYVLDDPSTAGCPNASNTLAPAASCQLAVDFTPKIGGANLGTVTATDNAINGGGTQTVALAGSGVGNAFTVTPSSLTFPGTLAGATSAGMTVTIANNAFNATAISPGTLSDTADYNETDNCGTSLAGNSSCIATFTFRPQSPGSLPSTFTLSGLNDPTQTITVSLTGTGTTGSVAVETLSPTSLNFPNVTAGSTSAAQPVTVTNTGTAQLSGFVPTLGGTNASQYAIASNNCTGALAPNASCVITITYTPSGATSSSATLAVATNASNSPQSVSITGSGAAALTSQATLNPTALTFPSTTVGVAATSLPVTLSNPGTGTLAITSITVGGANTSSFGQTNNCGMSLAAGASCTITVSFTPGAAGSLAASISVADNASGTPQLVAITGTGAAVAAGGATFTVNSSTPAVSIQPGGVAQFNLVIAPVGGVYTNVVMLSATGLPAGAQASFLPASVTPGAAGAPSVLSIQTATGLARVAAPEQREQTPVPLLALLAGLPLLGFAGASRKLRKSTARWMLLGLAALAVLPLLALSGCGGGYFGPAPQTYTVTVTGTSGALQQTTTVSLTVQ